MSIRSCVAATVLALWVPLTAGAALVLAAEGAKAKAEPELTVQGEVLDLACYLGHEAKGEGHANCAKQCLKSGQPMGLLTTDGTVYLLLASHTEPAPYEEAKIHAGAKVEVRGKAASRAGIKGLEVLSVKSL